MVKWLFGFSIVFFISVGSLFYYYTLKVDKLLGQIATLKAMNVKLNTNNKILKQKNKKFVATRKKIQTKLKQRKLRLVKLAKLKLAKAPLKMVPIVGAGLVVTATASDIYEYCQEIHSINKFENTLFGTKSEADEKICAIDVKKELEKTQASIDQSYDQYIETLTKQYGKTTKYWEKEIDSVIDKLNNESKQISKYLQDYFQGKQ